MIAALSGLAASGMAAQQLAAQKTSPDSRDVFAGANQSTTFPFEWREGMIVLPLSVHGSKSFRFVLDSGSTRTLIDRAVAASLGLKTGEASSAQGAGAGRVRLEAVHGVDLQLPGLESKGYDVYTADLAPLEQTLKTRVDGIVGYDLLARFAVTVDFAARQVTIASPSAFHPDTRAEQIPLDIHGKWAFLRGELVLPGPVTVQDNFFIDSGSSDAVDHPVVKTMQSRTASASGVGLGTPVEGAVARALSFRLGSFVMQGPLVSCCGATEETSRMIGTEILRRFTVTFDYPSSQLFLLPNDALHESFAASPSK
jgi:hypothetical protein